MSYVTSPSEGTTARKGKGANMRNRMTPSAAKRFAVHFNGEHTSDVYATSAAEAADLVREGSSWEDYCFLADEWDDRETVFDSFSLEYEDEDGDEISESFWLKIDPPEPKCRVLGEAPRPAHAWQERRVRGSGGGVLVEEECVHCGWRQVTDTWATNPCNGEQGHRTVRFFVPEDDA